MSDLAQLRGRLLVVFDGHCGLCNRSARWLLRRDRRDRLRFAPSESPKLVEMLERYGFSAADLPSGPGTIVVVRDAGGTAEQVLLRSDAAVALLNELPCPWPAMAFALRLVPRALRDLGYRVIARWRYRIWGRLESCPLPTVEERARFL